MWFIAGMAVVGLVCLLIGFVQHGFALSSAWHAMTCVVLGVGFVAIGLLELEWLERIIGFGGGLYGGLWQLLSGNWQSTLSESEWIGRNGATTIWLLLGIPTFVVGCLLGLHIFEF